MLVCCLKAKKLRIEHLYDKQESRTIELQHSCKKAQFVYEDKCIALISDSNRLEIRDLEKWSEILAIEDISSFNEISKGNFLAGYLNGEILRNEDYATKF